MNAIFLSLWIAKVTWLQHTCYTTSFYRLWKSTSSWSNSWLSPESHVKSTSKMHFCLMLNGFYDLMDSSQKSENRLENRLINAIFAIQSPQMHECVVLLPHSYIIIKQFYSMNPANSTRERPTSHWEYSIFNTNCKHIALKIKRAAVIHCSRNEYGLSAAVKHIHRNV